MEVEACDKGGNFIGWLYTEGKNLSVELVAVRSVGHTCTGVEAA